MTVFIIGNGFDINHGYDTSYLQFKKYLQSNNYPIYDIDLSEYFSNFDTKMWTDFENELEFIDFESEASDITETLTLDLDDKEYDRALSRNSVLLESFEEALKSIGSALCQALSNFVCETINNKHSKPKPYFNTLFSENDIFITFNYTKILEDIYHIDDTAIKHIHGIAYSNTFGNDEIEYNYEEPSIIFGHGNTTQTVYQDEKYDSNPFKPETCLKYINQKLVKNYQIEEMRQFLKTKQPVDTIEIIGHNLGIVDELYFIELNKIINTNVIIKFWLYDENLENEKEDILMKYFPGHKVEIKYYP